MELKIYLMCIFVLTSSLHFSNGCLSPQIQIQTISVYDNETGNVFSLSSGLESVTGINGVNGQEEDAVDSTAYFNATFASGTLNIEAKDQFQLYEENETAHELMLNVGLNCNGGSTSVITFIINIIDTNNNAPRFKPTDEFEFTLILPLPAGYDITACNNEIIVRDIDLTTYRIDFDIENNEYFEISYGGPSTTNPKEFKAVLTTKTVIRSLPELLALRISATDVDTTGDPPLTTSAAIHFKSNNDLFIPEEPIFSQTFYLATYTENHEVLLSQNIYLTEGFDDTVQFNLEGDYSDNFQLVINGNELSLNVKSPLPEETLTAIGQIYLIVRALKEYTTNPSATIIVELPEQTVLRFEKTSYIGRIENDSSTLDPIILTEGYRPEVQFSLRGELQQYFELTRNEHVITIELESNIPDENLPESGVIILELEARAPFAVAAFTSIVLEVVQEITVLRFDKLNYLGVINNNSSSLEPINLKEGYTPDVEFTLNGDLKEHFILLNDEQIVTIKLNNTLPEDAIPENGIIILELVALEPPATTAHATIVFEVVQEIPILRFDKSSYLGTINQDLFNLEPINLKEGYTPDVVFTLNGDLNQHFRLLNDEEAITIELINTLPEDAIPDNGIIILELEAISTPAITAYATIVLEVVQEITVLRFDKLNYLGVINNNSSSLEPINLKEGYTPDVEFTLNGDLKEHFILLNDGQIVTIKLNNTLPEDAIPVNGIIILELIALEPPGTTAHATIVFEVVQEIPILRFDKSSYLGTINQDLFNLEPINLKEGYTPDVVFTLNGDLKQHFRLLNDEEAITIELINTLPEDAIPDNGIIILELEAIAPPAITAYATIVLEVVQEITVLRFDKLNYLGVINNNSSSLEPINLKEGYTPDVEFTLNGDLKEHFILLNDGQIVTIKLNNTLPEDAIPVNGIIILELIALEPPGTTAHATIVFEVVQEIPILRFDKSSYLGTINQDLFNLEPINLKEGYTPDVVFTLNGDLKQHFRLLNDEETIIIELINILPEDAIPDNGIIILELEAIAPPAITAYATIVFEVVQEVTILRFDKTSYLGTINQDSFNLEHINLIEGYTSNVVFTLDGDLKQHFRVLNNEEIVTIELLNALPEEVIPNNGIVILELEATAPPAIKTHATIVFEVVQEITVLQFDKLNYLGVINNDSSSLEPINLQEGYSSDVILALNGDLKEHFRLRNDNEIVTIELQNVLPEEAVPDNGIVILELHATAPSAITAHATIVFEVVQENTILRFDKIHYPGVINNSISQLASITLKEGYTPDVIFSLNGDLKQHFRLLNVEEIITVELQDALPVDAIPNSGIIILELEAAAPSATAAHATIIFEVIQTNIVLRFDEISYLGLIENGLSKLESINLIEGYTSEVIFSLTGDFNDYFALSNDEAIVNIELQRPLPDEAKENSIIILELQASAPSSVAAYATIIFEVIQKTTTLRFMERNYLGLIQNDTSQLESIILIEGYTPEVKFSLNGDLAEYFNISHDEGIVSIKLQRSLTNDTVPANRIIILELEASAPSAVLAYTTIVFEVVQEDDTPAVDVLTFSKPYYTGYHTRADGLVFNNHISLDEGYDDEVKFDLEGDHSRWFNIEETENSVSLTLSNDIPEEVLVDNHQLIFSIIAQKPGNVTARTIIIISLKDEVGDITILRFEKVTYIGSIEDDESSLNPINLIEGYSSEVKFELLGDLKDYFILSNDGSIVSIQLQRSLTNDTIPANRIIILELIASAPLAVSAHTAVLFEVVQDDDTPIPDTLAFTEPHYTGYLTKADGLVFNNRVSLEKGYDEHVEFYLEGDHSRWFNIEQSENSVSLDLINDIPEEVFINNHQLVFSILAQKPGSVSARASIVISLMDEVRDITILRFEDVTYIGSIENNESSLNPINLIEGYSSQVEFELLGDLRDYFILSNDGPIVSIQLQRSLSNDTIPANRIIILELIATAPSAVSAHTAVLFEVVHDDDTPIPDTLAFTEPHYTGHLTKDDGLVFNNRVSLEKGYDEHVEFHLEGDHARWFSIEQAENSVSLNLISDIPEEAFINNHQLVFSILAQKPESVSVRATIVISLMEEVRDITILRFEKVTHIGSIEDDESNLNPINLIEGYSSEVKFELLGDLNDYFILSNDGAIVTIKLQRSLTNDTIPANGMIILELIASAPSAVSAHTTVLFEVVQDDDTPIPDTLAFTEPHYTGYLTKADGLVFNNRVSLEKGYDEHVEFYLEGDHSRWFSIEQSENLVSLSLTSDIPEEVFINNHQLVFSILAQKPGSASARASIVISLMEEVRDITILRFEKVTYIGSIENDESNLNPINLIEGYSSEVEFELLGDLKDYFILSNNGAIVSIQLQRSLTNDTIPANRIIILELIASAPSAVSAHTAVLFEVVQDDDTPIPDTLAFTEPHYTGYLTKADGLVFNNRVSLEKGYDEHVEFYLEGDHSRWFSTEQAENSLSLNLISDIPEEVFINNHQLVFSILAQKPGSVSARASIVISLMEEVRDITILRFEKVTYIGSIEDDESNLNPINLIEGYSSAVKFELLGDLNDYFILSTDGAIVTIKLQRSLTNDTIPANGMIILELIASAPSAVTAHTAVLFEVVQDDDTPIPDTLAFTEPHYTGYLTKVDGLVFNNRVSLEKGYDEHVEFYLEGDHSRWFSIEQSENLVSLSLTSDIPEEVFINNHQIVFSILAQKPGSVSARASIVISLMEEVIDITILRFEKVTYIGSIEDDDSSLNPINLIEGYSSEVEFELLGDLNDYFILSNDGAIVTIKLQRSLTNDTIPANGLIILELIASAPSAVSAHTTVLFEVVQDDDTPIPDTLAFTEPHYTGYLTKADGLVFNNRVSLEKGYDEHVEFYLEGDHSRWFSIEQSENLVSLSLTSDIPEEVFINNHQLVFSILAQKPGSVSARASIVISLMEEVRDITILRFEKVTYIGSIEDDDSSLNPINLIEGYSSEVEFELLGDLNDYFILSNDGPIVTIKLQRSLTNDTIPANGMIILELIASAPSAVSAHTTVLFKVVQDDDTPIPDTLAFTELHYTGYHTKADGLVFNNRVSLEKGYDEHVEFYLEGDHSRWFSIEQSENLVSLSLTSDIPEEVFINNHQLVFSILAQKPGSVSARASIVISLMEEVRDITILRFEKVTYIGSIEDDDSSLNPINLIEGYSSEVEFELLGDLNDYFILSNDGAIVTIKLQRSLTNDTIPANGLIILELIASAPSAVSAHTTVLFEVAQDDDTTIPDTLAFTEPHYTGYHTKADGLVFNNRVSLEKGYDEHVEFYLEGDHSRWFSIEQSENLVSLSLTSDIPEEVFINNHQLVFSILAQKPGSVSARASIVISLMEEVRDITILRFEKVTYIGSIEDDDSSLNPINLIEGYSSEVEFELLGDLNDYFILSNDGAIVTIKLQRSLTNDTIPANGLIILELIASAPSAVSAHTTVLFEVVQDDDTPIPDTLAFTEPHYTGYLTKADGLVFNNLVSLEKGYDEHVEFYLEGDQSRWFSIEQSENLVSLRLTSDIPEEVFINNHQLVFSILAQKPGSVSARASIVISLMEEVRDITILRFEKVTYIGSIEDDDSSLNPINLIEGYSSEVEFELLGDLNDYFILSNDGAIVTIKLQRSLTNDTIPANGMIILELIASAPSAVSAHTTILFEVVQDDDTPISDTLAFTEPHYTGYLTKSDGLVFNNRVSLEKGYDEHVEFYLEGDHSRWFSIEQSENLVSLSLISDIPEEVFINNHQLVFSILAQKPGSVSARASIVISLMEEVRDITILRFEKVTYIGSIEDDDSSLNPINLIEGYSSEVEFELLGDLNDYFILSNDGAIVTIKLQRSLTNDTIPANGLIILELIASAPSAVSAHTTVLFEVVQDDDTPIPDTLAFTEPHYTGYLTKADGLVFNNRVSLEKGYDEHVEFYLEGDHSRWFSIEQSENLVSLSLTSDIPEEVFINNHQLVFSISAQKPGSVSARASIVISLMDEVRDIRIMRFEKVTYIGSIENDESSLNPINLIEGYSSEVKFELLGDLKDYFIFSNDGAIVTIVLQRSLTNDTIPANRLIILELEASAPSAVSAFTAIVFEVVQEEDTPTLDVLTFSEPYYVGNYTEAEGLTFNQYISLAEGYDEHVQFGLRGDYSEWFVISVLGNSVSLSLQDPIPQEIVINNHQLVLSITAQKPGSNTANAIIIISLKDSQDISFDNLLYQGFIENNNVRHEVIRVLEYTGSNIEIRGEFATSFKATMDSGSVTIQAESTLILPESTTHVVLELHAGGASAVLVLDVDQTEAPRPPEVTFSSALYVIEIEVAFRGLIGQVSATADNEEPIRYNLLIENEHLQTRLSINDKGEIFLNSPANSGVHNFQVVATTAYTRVNNTAAVRLTVEAVTICDTDDIRVPPLIILDRDEEESHTNLVVLGEHSEKCRYILTNRWPINQSWLYVDDDGLHTRAIDREDPSIAFMALSQVQVELFLDCNSDDAKMRNKRSVNPGARQDWLGPYDYGNNKWILTDTINYNSRRTLVNLIVNDINDNAPVFVGKEHEPIVVGYPVAELEEIVLPRALSRLTATDADIGENAAIRYWSSDPVLAVSPHTGYVHVRNMALLEDNVRLTVNATDRDGAGLTGSIDIVVKHLNISNIAVITIENAFLEDEENILANISGAVGYNVIALRSVVISEDNIEDELEDNDEEEEIEENSRRKRSLSNEDAAKLQLYVYGLIQMEPVHVDQLSEDINNSEISAVNLASSISLEDYLQSIARCVIPGRDTGLLAATIVLSVLLFILIMTIAVWYFLKWRKKRLANESDRKSLVSSNSSIDEIPKPEMLMKPRLNIEELKRSERRLQERLEASAESVPDEPSPSNKVSSHDTKINMTEPDVPIVIQSIDKLKDSDDTDDDEFGEKKDGKRRKSVVTFNENVERIIHLEDSNTKL